MAGRRTVIETGDSFYIFVVYVKPSLKAEQKEEIIDLLMTPLLTFK